jgi:hypothetical protein
VEGLRRRRGHRPKRHQDLVRADDRPDDRRDLPRLLGHDHNGTNFSGMVWVEIIVNPTLPTDRTATVHCRPPPAATDCDDDDPGPPGHIELCDDKDNDCNKPPTRITKECFSPCQGRPGVPERRVEQVQLAAARQRGVQRARDNCNGFTDDYAECPTGYAARPGAASSSRRAARRERPPPDASDERAAARAGSGRRGGRQEVDGGAAAARPRRARAAALGGRGGGGAGPVAAPSPVLGGRRSAEARGGRGLAGQGEGGREWGGSGAGVGRDWGGEWAGVWGGSGAGVGRGRRRAGGRVGWAALGPGSGRADNPTSSTDTP